MTLIWRSLPLPICLVIIQLVAFLRRVFSMALQHGAVTVEGGLCRMTVVLLLLLWPSGLAAISTRRHIYPSPEGSAASNAESIPKPVRGEYVGKSTWPAWLWRVVTRTPPPPLENMDPIEPVCSSWGCLSAVGCRLGLIVLFVLRRCWILLRTPTRWTAGLSEEFHELLYRLREVEIEASGFALWGLLVGSAMWMLLKLVWRVKDALPRRVNDTTRQKSDARLTKLESALERLVVAQTQAQMPASRVQSNGRALGKATKKPCPNCGQLGHTLWTCPQPKRCLYCRREDHLAKDCPQRLRANSANAAVTGPVLAEEGTELRPLLEASIDQVDGPGSSSRRLLHVRAHLGDAQEDVLLDTGSSVNVLPIELAKARQWKVDPECEETKLTLVAFNRSKSRIIGRVLLPIRIGMWKATVPFVVTDVPSQIILGLPALADLGVQIDPAHSLVLDQEGNQVRCNLTETIPPEFRFGDCTSKN